MGATFVDPVRDGGCDADLWRELGNPPERPKPVTITPKPVLEARPAGADGDEQF